MDHVGRIRFIWDISSVIEICHKKYYFLNVKIEPAIIYFLKKGVKNLK